MENYGIYYTDPKDGHIEDDYFDNYPEAEEQAIYLSKEKDVEVAIWEIEAEIDHLIARVQKGRVIARYASRRK